MAKRFKSQRGRVPENFQNREAYMSNSSVLPYFLQITSPSVYYLVFGGKHCYIKGPQQIVL